MLLDEIKDIEWNVLMEYVNIKYEIDTYIFEWIENKSSFVTKTKLTGKICEDVKVCKSGQHLGYFSLKHLSILLNWV